MKDRKRILFIIGLIVLFGGLNLTILLSHLSRYVGVVLIGMGLAIILFTTRGYEKEAEKRPAERPKNLGAGWIHILTLEGRLKPFFPVFGMALVVFVIYFNAAVSTTQWLGSNDYIVLILAGVLISYNYIPKKFDVERNFALIFIAFLFLILVVPTTLYSLGDSGEVDTNSRITYYLLAAPTAALSNLFGVGVTLPEYNLMLFTGPDGQTVNLWIALSCTGLYSVSIFVSGFIAFVSVEYSKFDKKVGKLLVLGIFFAWMANVIRMTIIVLVGKRYGTGAMEWTHNNIGEIFFMIWVSVFWLVMFRYLNVWDDLGGPPRKSAPPEKAFEKREGEDEGKTSARRSCGICGGALSSTIPAYRCRCGKIYHQGCTRTGEVMACPECGKPFTKK